MHVTARGELFTQRAAQASSFKHRTRVAPWRRAQHGELSLELGRREENFGEPVGQWALQPFSR